MKIAPTNPTTPHLTLIQWDFYNSMRLLKGEGGATIFVGFYKSSHYSNMLFFFKSLCQIVSTGGVFRMTITNWTIKLQCYTASQLINISQVLIEFAERSCIWLCVVQPQSCKWIHRILISNQLLIFLSLHTRFVFILKSKTSSI